MHKKHKRLPCPFCQSLRTVRAFPDVPKGFCEACHRAFNITPELAAAKRISVQALAWGYGSR
jgi:hypothetical protein